MESLKISESVTRQLNKDLGILKDALSKKFRIDLRILEVNNAMLFAEFRSFKYGHHLSNIADMVANCLILYFQVYIPVKSILFLCYERSDSIPACILERNYDPKSVSGEIGFLNSVFRLRAVRSEMKRIYPMLFQYLD